MAPRARTPSGHDVPVPEAVFQGMLGLQKSIETHAEATRTWQANHDSEHRALGEKLATALASKQHDWAKILMALAVAVPAIIGGVRATTPTPAPVQIETRYTPVDPRMAECAPLQPGTQAQAECFARVQAEIQSGKRPAPATP